MKESTAAKKEEHMLTEQEKIWSQEAVKKCLKNGKISAAKIRDMKLCDEFKKEFGRKITPTGLHQRLWRLNPEYRGSKTRNAAEISNYLVYVKATGQIGGYETEDEVRTFIETNQVLGNDNIRIFKYMPTKVEYKITIGG